MEEPIDGLTQGVLILNQLKMLLVSSSKKLISSRLTAENGKVSSYALGPAGANMNAFYVV